MSFNFEGQSRRQEDKIFINQAFEAARRVLSVREIQLRDFNDLYEPSITAKDQERVASLEAKIQQQNTPEKAEALRLATVFEAVFLTQAESNKWFGKNATLIKTSRYDDIFNGVDCVAELEEDSSMTHLGLVIDVTLARDLSEKFERIKAEIENRRLAKVKYFKSSRMNFRGELSQVPRVIVAGDARTIKDLAYLWLSSGIFANQEKLHNHFFQFQVLEEIALQLKFFGDYATRIGNTSLAAIYEKALKLVNKVLKEKRTPNSGTIDSWERDEALDEIKAVLSRLFS